MPNSHDPFGGYNRPTDDIAPAAETQPTPKPQQQQQQETQPETSQPAPAQEPQAEPAQELKVPAGTTKEVLAWVGDDKDRARAALEVEQKSGEPRKGLTRELEERVG